MSGLYYFAASPALADDDIEIIVKTALVGSHHPYNDYANSHIEGFPNVIYKAPKFFSNVAKVVQRIRIRIAYKNKVVGDLQFMGTHMPSPTAGDYGDYTARLNMYTQAWLAADRWSSRTQLPTPTFFAGDMNWRVTGGNQGQCIHCTSLQGRQYTSDEGGYKANKKSGFIQEAPIKFQPTYKRNDEATDSACYKASLFEPETLDKLQGSWTEEVAARQLNDAVAGNDCYILKKGGKPRHPSWTDRVMFYPFNGASIDTRYYTDYYRSEHEKCDHRMVVWAGDVEFQPLFDSY